MATESIFAQVTITDEEAAWGLIRAYEAAEAERNDPNRTFDPTPYPRMTAEQFDRHLAKIRGEKE